MITSKFYLKHLCGGKASVGFDPEPIRNLVSMATDSSLRIIMGKRASSRFSGMLLIGSFSYFQVTMTCMRAWMSSKFGRIRPQTVNIFKQPLTPRGRFSSCFKYSIYMSGNK